MAHGNKRGTSCFSSVTSKKSGNPKCRKFSTSPPSSEKFDFSIKPLRVFHSGTASIFSSEFGEANKQSVYSKLSLRVSNPIPVRTSASSVSTCDSNEFRTNNFSRSRNTRNAKKGAIKPANFSQKQFLSLIFLVPKKDSGHRALLNLKILNLCTFQYERVFFAEGIASGKRLHVQNKRKTCLCFSAAEPRVANVYKVQTVRSKLSVYLPLVWSSTSIKDIYITTRNSHFSG